MCGLIPGETIPSSRSGSRDDRLTKYCPIRMFIPCRAGTGTYFPVGLENVISRAGVDCLRVRRKRKNISCFPECGAAVGDHHFPCLSTCVNFGSKLSLGLAAGTAGKRFIGICGGHKEFAGSFHSRRGFKVSHFLKTTTVTVIFDLEFLWKNEYFISIWIQLAWYVGSDRG